MLYIDTHCHIDGTEFDEDRSEVMARAREAGCAAICVPAIDAASTHRIVDLCRQHPGYLFPMAGLHPEEVRADWPEQLDAVRGFLTPHPFHHRHRRGGARLLLEP